MRNHGKDEGAPLCPPTKVEDLRPRVGALKELGAPELRALWREAWGRPAPRGARRRLLMLGIAWQWQARIHGGLAKETKRRLAALEAIRRERGAVPADVWSVAPRLMPGARLLRVWRDERHEVHVVEDGFLWRGKTWASLSAIARAITGTRRNGPAFFGIRKRESGR